MSVAYALPSEERASIRSAPGSARPLRLLNVQALRAIAALAVVVHHVVFTLNDYLAAGRYHIQLHACAAGVDVFFVVSGFIMAQTALAGPSSPAKFWWARIARVVPTYWLLTLVAAAAVARGFQLFGWRHLSLEHLLTSLAFVPSFGPDGLRSPLVFVGWTLNYEMFFYFVFGLALVFRSPRVRAAVLGMSLTAIWAASAVVSNRYLAYWGRPIIMEFVAGVALYGVVRRWTLSPRPALAILAWAVLALTATAFFDEAAVHAVRPLVWGVPALAVVWAALSLEWHGWRLAHPAVQRLGDASYAIYLTHVFVLQFAAKLVVATHLPSSLGRDLAYALLVFPLAVGAGIAFYQGVERPIQGRLRTLTRGTRPALARS